MFDITPDDINQLNDTDLRELVGRLCEAELVSLGLSPAAVTWGGSQTAPDGGLDVRVALPSGVLIEGFVPRLLTGFQVKKPDMPRSDVLAEMRPEGVIRPVIQDLADEAGAYIIVSASGSTADVALRNRREALREALCDVVNADQLHTDFYDRTRLATWVRRHPGIITWVKERVGRALVGWRPYGPWSGVVEGIGAEYILDDKLRLHFDRDGDTPAKSVTQAIDELRDELAQPGKIVRLVGLSGVGKTRLVQALFDSRIGLRSLAPSLAVYANLSDTLNPQPTGLASDLIANRTRAVLIVDNCSAELHRSLSEICNGPSSTISVLTVEYDIREDQPEGTQVVTLDTSSTELIEKITRRRFPHLSDVDAQTVAKASGGNARIAIALAETVERTESIAGLSNDDLFQRLFRQRQAPNDALMLAAKVCSLVYSFQGEALSGTEAELPRLAALAGQSEAEIFRHVSELLRRDLVQRRGRWRAVLPHAIANHLAARALEDLPIELINQQLVQAGAERLARSFSRRLSFLHKQPKAVAIVEEWLGPDGLLGNIADLNALGRAMFENVAPVSPEATLAALERVAHRSDVEATVDALRPHLLLLRSLAFDASMFARCTELLISVATLSVRKVDSEKAADVFVSLFTIHLSGTHATIEQRLDVIENLLKLHEAKSRTLGLTALRKVLEAFHFSSYHGFDFGARSRDYGYQPKTYDDVSRWYGAALAFVEKITQFDESIKGELLDLLAACFRSLWTYANMSAELDRIFRSIAKEAFWRAGWLACRQTLRFDREQMPPELQSTLSALEHDLRPDTLLERVRAVVLGGSSGGVGLDDIDDDESNSHENLDKTAEDFGATVALDDAVFEELLPELLRGGNRVWQFGGGVARASSDIRGIWVRFVKGLEEMEPELRNVQLLRGFLAGLWERDSELTHSLLDSALSESVLQSSLPVLQSAVELDEHGVDRLKKGLVTRISPIWMYRNLRFGSVTAPVAGGSLKSLVLLIADQPDGINVALEVLHARLFSDAAAKLTPDPQVQEAGRELLRRVSFDSYGMTLDYLLGSVLKDCWITPLSGLSIVAELATRLRQAVVDREADWSQSGELLKTMFQLDASAVLDVLFQNDDDTERLHGRVLDHFSGYRGNPVDAISCADLIAWCEIDRERRYVFAASIVSFAHGVEGRQARSWSEQAIALLSHSPNPEPVLAIFVKQFRPTSWSGSLASVMEGNAQLLDELDPAIRSLPFVAEAKAGILRAIEAERQWEMKQDRERDERFE